MIIAKNSVGEISGTVIRKKRRVPLAPSTAAASSRSSGTEFSAALINMKAKPRFCQMLTVATAGRAQVGFPRIPTPPRCPIQYENSPVVGSRRVKNITDATATEVAIVEEKIVRKIRIPARCRCAKTAIPSPRMIPAGTVNSTYKVESQSGVRNSECESTEEYCDKPTYFCGRPGNGGTLYIPR